MMIREQAVPPLMLVGGGALNKVGAIVKKLGAARPLVVTDHFMTQIGIAQSVLDSLAAEGLAEALFNETVPDPTSASLAAGLKAIQEHHADIVIGLGGGSPIDTAKALSVLALHGGTMRELKAPVRYDGPALPLVAIPTTAGTGSETTQTTVITDSENGEKMLCIGPSYLPKAAIIDYKLTLSMPPRLSADTGIDALTHAIEAYVSKKSNNFSDALALHAMRLIGQNLRTVYHNGSDKRSRSAMMEAADLAGMAFSNSSVALVHAMSRPLGSHFHVAHGMANAMLFAAVTRFSLGIDDTRYAECARALGVATTESSTVQAAEALVLELETLKKELAVPTPEDFGIDKAAWDQAVPTMAQQAIASGSHLNNPRIPTVEQIEKIYEDIYHQ